MTTEGNVKRQICDYLSTRPDCFFWVQESQGTYDRASGKFRKKLSKYQKNGVADIQLKIMILGAPVDVQIEVKSDKGRQSIKQKIFQKQVEFFGGFYFVARSVHDVILAIQSVKEKIAARLGK